MSTLPPLPPQPPQLPRPPQPASPLPELGADRPVLWLLCAVRGRIPPLFGARSASRLPPWGHEPAAWRFQLT